MKKHNILKVILFSILLLVLCTWIFPTINSSTTIVEGERIQLGLFDLFSYPLVAFSYFGYTFVFVLLVGAFYGILNKIPAYKALLNKIVKVFSCKEWLFISLASVIIAILTSVTGLSFGFIVLFPLIISVILMMGYNKLVAATVTVGSVAVGLMGTTFGNSSVAYLNHLLETTVFDEMISKVIILVLGLGILLFNLLTYAKKTKNDKVEDEEKLIPETIKVKKEQKVKIWPLALVFDLMILILVLGSISWEAVFGVDLFHNITTSVSEFKLFGFPIFGKLLGTVGAFGEWSFNVEYPFIIICGALIIAAIYRVRPSELYDNVVTGMKKAIYPATVVILIYVLLVIATFNPFQLYIANFILGLTNGLNVVTMSVVALLSSFFNADSIYVAQSTVPFVTHIITDASLYPLIGLIFQSIYGLAMLVLPSSIILMGTLSYMNISYKQWLKHIWKVLLEIFVLLLIIFIVILALI